MLTSEGGPGVEVAPTGKTTDRFRYPGAHADCTGEPLALRAMRNGDHRRQGHRWRGVVLRDADGPARELNGGNEMANLMGKRYTCSVCEATVLVTKAGEGELSCHSQAMEIAQAKPLPSSD